MYYLTIFTILTDIKIGGAVYQEIDKKFLKQMDSLEELEMYLYNIKNKNLMNNFPYAAIEKIINGKRPRITDQLIYRYNSRKNAYAKVEKYTELAPSTLTMINPLENPEFVFGA